MVERNRETPDTQGENGFKPPSLAEELRNTLDPITMLHNYMTMPPCGPVEILRDLPAIGITIIVSSGLAKGIVDVHEMLNLQNPESIRPVEVLAWGAATLAIMAISHYVARRYLPPPFRH